MKKFIIGTVFTAAAALIFMVSFSMVSGINNSYALQINHKVTSGKMNKMNMSGKATAKKTSKTKNNSKKSKSTNALNKMGAGCL